MIEGFKSHEIKTNIEYKILCNIYDVSVKIEICFDLNEVCCLVFLCLVPFHFCKTQ